jgi:CheY-like chemotaxis protein
MPEVVSQTSRVINSDPSSIRGRAAISPQILIVDDEAQLRDLLAETFVGRHLQVVTAADGVEALDLIEIHPGIQLILSDVVMPGMNGHEMVEKALQRRPEMKVILITAYAAEVPPLSLLKAREIRTLYKPFDVDDACSLAIEMLSRG